MEQDYIPMEFDSDNEFNFFDEQEQFPLNLLDDYCPEVEDITVSDDMVTIITKDAVDFRISKDVASRSGTLRDIIKDAVTKRPIPLTSITAATWRLLQGKLEQEHFFQITKTSEDPWLWKQMNFDAYKDLESKSLVKLMRAANYLDMPRLLNATTSIAKMYGIEKILPKHIAQLPKEIGNPIIWSAVFKLLGPQLIQYIRQYPKNSYKSRYENGHGKLTACYWNNAVQLWDTQAKHQILTFELFLDCESSVCATPDGKSLLVGTGNNVTVMNVEKRTYKQKYSGHTGVVSVLDVTSDSQKVVTGSHDYTIRVWDRKSGKQLACCMGHMGGVRALCITRDDSRIVSSSWDGSLRVWDIESGKQLAKHKRSPLLLSMCVTPDNEYIVSNHFDRSVHITDIKTGQEYARFLGSSEFTYSSLVVTPDGKKMLAGNWDNSVDVWDIAILKKLKKLKAINKQQRGQVWELLQSVSNNTISAQDGITRLKEIISASKSRQPVHSYHTRSNKRLKRANQYK